MKNQARIYIPEQFELIKFRKGIDDRSANKSSILDAINLVLSGSRSKVESTVST